MADDTTIAVDVETIEALDDSSEELSELANHVFYGTGGDNVRYDLAKVAGDIATALASIDTE